MPGSLSFDSKTFFNYILTSFSYLQTLDKILEIYVLLSEAERQSRLRKKQKKARKYDNNDFLLTFIYILQIKNLLSLQGLYQWIHRQSC